jgi:hypothetical protein
MLRFLEGSILAETPPTVPPAVTVTLSQAGQRLEMPTRELANMARRYGLFVAVGRNVVFTEAHIKALKARIKEAAYQARREALQRSKPKKTFGIHESDELRKERRRAKKRQVKKEVLPPK